MSVLPKCSLKNIRRLEFKKVITMIDDGLLQRITVNPEIFGGKPIIRGMRISVELILGLLAQGETPETILTDYPDLEPEDLRACLAYAHTVIAHDKLDSVHISHDNEVLNRPNGSSLTAPPERPLMS
jgi:uncharacterized protein (DUF433 family)